MLCNKSHAFVEVGGEVQEICTYLPNNHEQKVRQSKYIKNVNLCMQKAIQSTDHPRYYDEP